MKPAISWGNTSGHRWISQRSRGVESVAHCRLCNLHWYSQGMKDMEPDKELKWKLTLVDALVSQQGRQDPPDAPRWTSMFWCEKRGKGTRFVGDGGGVRQWAFNAHLSHLSYCSLLTWCSWMQLSVTNATIDKTTGKVSLYASSWSSSCAWPSPMGSTCPTRCSNLVMAACTQKLRRTFKQHIDTSMNKRTHVQLQTENKTQYKPCTWTHYSLFSHSILGLGSTTLPGSRCCHRCHRSDASH